jgi:uncharacterized damage-inducible protein DinB
MKLSRVFSHWDQVREDLLTTIDQFDDSELLFTPFDSSWPVGQIMLHIGSAEAGWFCYVISQELIDWPIFDMEVYPTCESIKTLLVDIHDMTKSQLASWDLEDLERPIRLPWNNHELSLSWIIWHVLEHEIHHRGELSLVLGLLGRDGLDV